MRLLPLLAVAGIATDVSAQSMKSRFTISSTCAGKDVDSILKEAIELADAAITAIEPMVQNDWTSLKSVGASAMFAAQVAFGVQKPGMFQFKLPEEDKTQLKKAQDNFRKVKTALSSTAKPVDNVLHCDSKRLKWTTKVKDIFISKPYQNVDAKTTMKEFFAKNGATSPVNGLWLDPDHKTSNGDNNFINDEYDGKTICGAHASEAITWSQGEKNMFLCPKAFEASNYRKTLSDIKDKEQSVKYEAVQSLPGVFLHEMFHWIRTTPHITDEVVSIEGKNYKAYGMLPCWHLAGNQGGGNKAKTLTNADSYHVFATMVYLKGTTFDG